MTQEDKDLLLKDLCARVYYRVKFNHEDKHTLCKILYIIPIYDYFNVIYYDNAINEPKKTSIDNVKPYLFPLSSMTEEQSMELFKLFGISLVDSIGADYIKINECTGITFFLDKGFDVETHLDKLIDWLNKNHFDYRGLIERGLALDATGLNIY